MKGVLRCGAWMLILSTLPVFSQQRVDARNLHERPLCAVPMVGAGTPEDPRRPMYVPLPPGSGEQPSRSGMIGFAYGESDDGRFALVEFVAVDRSASTSAAAG